MCSTHFQYVDIQTDYASQKLLIWFFKDEKSKSSDARKIVNGCTRAPELLKIKPKFTLAFEKIINEDVIYSVPM